MLTSRRALSTAAALVAVWLQGCSQGDSPLPQEGMEHRLASTSARDESPIATGAGSAHTITLDRYSLSIDGQRIYLWAGEFHYWRLPSPALWRDVLEKMKAAGFNAANIYFHWGYHSAAPGVFDFTGIRDVDELLDVAEEVGIYVIARPGPYINAETDSGGLPAWLDRLAGQKRSPDPAYLAHVDEWLTQIDARLTRHQLTNGTGTIIVNQVENEFTDTSDAGRAYMQHLIDRFRADGITVPLTGNHWNRFNTGTVGLLDVDGWDAYPQGFNCSNPTRWSAVPDLTWLRDLLTDRPLFFPEYQGGAFDFWGGPGYENCRRLTGPDFERVFYSTNIAVGSTMQSFYMTYGGTSWGYLPFPGVYTSYDYGAAITESRQLTSKYEQQKLFGTFLAAAAPITRTDSLPAPVQSNPAIWVRGRMNPDDGTQLYVLRHVDGASTGLERTHLGLQVASGEFYPTVPQEPGTALVLDGRDAKLLLANYRFGGQRMMYSTSQLLTHVDLDGVDVAVLYGPAGEDGETVLRYSSQPEVNVLSGSAAASWDDARGDLRLNYRHSGLAKVLIVGGGFPDLVLLLAEQNVAAQFWRFDTSAGTVLARGPYLIRGASVRHGRLALRGDTAMDTTLEVYAPRAVRDVTWNRREVSASGSVDPVTGPLTAQLAGPEPTTLPELDWRYRFDTPEADPAFDDFHWALADHLLSENADAGGLPPVLGADEYGFHHGHVWYRGHFTAYGSETELSVNASTGNSTGQYAVWLNGAYLGTGNGGTTFPLQPSSLLPGQDNEVSVLIANMGHDQGTGKTQRGLVSARLFGSRATITWRVRGALGGEDLVDPARGPMNSGGLHGERAGWHLPGFPDREWQPVSLPHADGRPGVAWYRAVFDLDLPRGQDVPIALRLSDGPARRYRVQIYLNGWNLGLYVNDVGPQHDFVLPAGLLRTEGENTLALAVWSSDATGGLGTVSLVVQGNYRGGVDVSAVGSPRYEPRTYFERPAPAHLTLAAPDQIPRGNTATVTATLSLPRDRRPVSGGTLTLSVPGGWQLAGNAVVPVGRLRPGQSMTAEWTVVAPAGDQPSATMFVARADLDTHRPARSRAVDAGKTVAVPPPPPSGDLFVSDLPFQQATNGWGPVERDTSNGEQAAGDGRPITLDGTVHARGLGAHAPGDITIYLGGNCTSFTSVVGIDDEAGASGSVRFRVLVDNREQVDTGVLTGASAPLPLDVDIAGGEWLDLVLDEAGDGNGLDHADWADATIHCN